ncbi:MAG: YheV family putative metal-binding protein [Cellvibrionales bacterium]|nr:YheV family putative metal-binding protein [Cellvibrionales bacterium]
MSANDTPARGIVRKRFIAAAICPHCATQDTVYTYQRQGRPHRACTRCDLDEPLPTAIPPSTTSEPATRVNRAAQSRPNPAEPLRLRPQPQPAELGSP